MVEMPEPMLIMGRKIMVSTRYAVVMAATVWVPNPFIKFCKIRFPKALTQDWTMGGNPR